MSQPTAPTQLRKSRALPHSRPCRQPSRNRRVLYPVKRQWRRPPRPAQIVIRYAVTKRQPGGVGLLACANRDPLRRNQGASPSPPIPSRLLLACAHRDPLRRDQGASPSLPILSRLLPDLRAPRRGGFFPRPIAPAHVNPHPLLLPSPLTHFSTAETPPLPRPLPTPPNPR